MEFKKGLTPNISELPIRSNVTEESKALLATLKISFHNKKSVFIPIFKNHQRIGKVDLNTQAKQIVYVQEQVGCRFDAYAYMPKAFDSAKYNFSLKQYEVRTPVIRGAEHIGYWVFKGHTQNWWRISHFVSRDGKVSPFGTIESAPYQKDITLCCVCLKNIKNQDMCRLWTQKGTLVRCEELEGFQQGCYTAAAFKMRTEEKTLVRNQKRRRKKRDSSKEYE